MYNFVVTPTIFRCFVNAGLDGDLRAIRFHDDDDGGQGRMGGQDGCADRTDARTGRMRGQGRCGSRWHWRIRLLLRRRFVVDYLADVGPKKGSSKIRFEIFEKRFN